MARYGRRSNHWIWQPRDSRGRFSYDFGSGGSSGGDPEWFQRMPWWKKLLVVFATAAISLALFYWCPGLFMLLAIFGWIGILAGK